MEKELVTQEQMMEVLCKYYEGVMNGYININK